MWVDGVAWGEENLSGRVNNGAETEENIAEILDNIHEKEDNMNSPEKLRDVRSDVHNEILVGSLSNFIGEGIGQKLVVQIVEVIRVEGVISVIISDGNNY